MKLIIVYVSKSVLATGVLNCATTSVRTSTITFSPTFASVPKFALGVVNFQRETQGQSFWTIRYEIFSISTSNVVI
jgi:hypothetical protein